jgi:CRISPR/Cas system-associated exonuclease Cas4 (RecB family)
MAVIEAIAAVAVAAILVVWICFAMRRRRLRRGEHAWLPPELEHARIAFAERYFSTKRPLRLVAKVDRAYRSARGALVLTELKTRSKRRAYTSDVVELSAQKVAVERGGHRVVAETGYVVVEHPISRKRVPIAVRLMEEEGIVAMAERYQRLIEGNAMPEQANIAGLCRGCAYAERCQPEVLRNAGSRQAS